MTDDAPARRRALVLAGGGIEVAFQAGVLSFGPVITSAIRGPDALQGGDGRGFYIGDAGYPVAMNWLLEAADDLIRRSRSH